MIAWLVACPFGIEAEWQYNVCPAHIFVTVKTLLLYQEVKFGQLMVKEVCTQCG